MRLGETQLERKDNTSVLFARTMGIIGTNAKKGDPADIAAMMSVRY